MFILCLQCYFTEIDFRTVWQNGVEFHRKVKTLWIAPLTTLYFFSRFTQVTERDHFSQFITEGYTSYCKRKRRDKVWMLHQSMHFTSLISSKAKSVMHLAYFRFVYHLLNIRICLHFFLTWRLFFCPRFCECEQMPNPVTFFNPL